MGLARSHVRDLLGHHDGWTDGRSHRTPNDDAELLAELLAELRQEIAQLPSYGYRRACVLVNRQRTARGAARGSQTRLSRHGRGWHAVAESTGSTPVRTHA